MEEVKLPVAKSLDIMQLLRVVLRKWFIVVIAGIVAATIGFIYSSYYITPLYRASSTMLVDLRNSVHEDLSSEQINVAEKYVTTFAYIMKTNIVLQPVIDELGLKESVSSLASKISIQPLEQTLLIRVSIKYPDPNLAVKIVKSIGQNAPEIINQRITSGYITEIESPSVTTNPVTPNIPKYTVTAAVLGVALAVFVIIAFVLFNNKIKSVEDLQETVDLPLLGVIPALQKKTVKELKSDEKKQTLY